jgi:hypothetical protein
MPIYVPMFDRLLGNTPGEARSRLLAVLAVTTWGSAAVAIVAGWILGLAALALGAIVFRQVRARSGDTDSPTALIPAAPRRPDDSSNDAEPDAGIAVLEDRVLARLRTMAPAESDSPRPHPPDSPPPEFARRRTHPTDSPPPEFAIRRTHPTDSPPPEFAIRRTHPTEPSICSSIRRLHSTAYSIGRVRVTGSMNPLTTMPIACSCERPRLIR